MSFLSVPLKSIRENTALRLLSSIPWLIPRPSKRRLILFRSQSTDLILNDRQAVTGGYAWQVWLGGLPIRPHCRHLGQLVGTGFMARSNGFNGTIVT